jgi:hypothetical protein
MTLLKYKLYNVPRVSWCTGKVLDLYSRGAHFESWTVVGAIMIEVFRRLPQILQANFDVEFGLTTTASFHVFPIHHS